MSKNLRSSSYHFIVSFTVFAVFESFFIYFRTFSVLQNVTDPLFLHHCRLIGSVEIVEGCLVFVRDRLPSEIFREYGYKLRRDRNHKEQRPKQGRKYLCHQADLLYSLALRDIYHDRIHQCLQTCIQHPLSTLQQDRACLQSQVDKHSIRGKNIAREQRWEILRHLCLIK